MGILWAQGITAPGGWLPVLKKLRATGGPATAWVYPNFSTSDLTGIDALMSDELNRVDDPDDIPF